MSRADVLQLVQDFSALQSDDTEATRYYDEIVRELGFHEVLTDVEQRQYSLQDNSLYKMSDDVMRLLEFAWDNRRLDRSSEFALRALFGAGWQLRRGDPVAVTEWSESAGVMRLAPEPTRPGTITVIKTETRDELPYWLELPVALLIVSREFSRESNHQDVKFAGIAAELGTLFLLFLGVQHKPEQQQQQEQS